MTIKNKLNRCNVLNDLKRVTGLLAVLVVVVLFSGSGRNTDLQSNLSVLQHQMKANFAKGMYEIEQGTFEIVIGGVNMDDNIEIFVYDTPEMFYRYSWPERIGDTVTFAPATGIAMALEEDKSFSLCINTENSKNYISGDRRINRGNTAILLINGISDTLKTGVDTDIFYLSIFVDGNKNRIVEKDEVAHLILRVIPGGM